MGWALPWACFAKSQLAASLRPPPTHIFWLWAASQKLGGLHVEVARIQHMGSCSMMLQAEHQLSHLWACRSSQGQHKDHINQTNPLHGMSVLPAPSYSQPLTQGQSGAAGCLAAAAWERSGLSPGGDGWVRGQTLLAARCHGLPSPTLSTGIGRKSPAVDWPSGTGMVAGASAHPAAGGVLSNEPSSLGLCSKPKDKQCPQRLCGMGALTHRSSSQRACDRAQSPGKH